MENYINFKLFVSSNYFLNTNLIKISSNWNYYKLTWVLSEWRPTRYILILIGSISIYCIFVEILELIDLTLQFLRYWTEINFDKSIQSFDKANRTLQWVNFEEYLKFFLMESYLENVLIRIYNFHYLNLSFAVQHLVKHYCLFGYSMSNVADRNSIIRQIYLSCLRVADELTVSTQCCSSKLTIDTGVDFHWLTTEEQHSV